MKTCIALHGSPEKISKNRKKHNHTWSVWKPDPWFPEKLSTRYCTLCGKRQIL